MMYIDFITIYSLIEYSALFISVSTDCFLKLAIFLFLPDRMAGNDAQRTMQSINRHRHIHFKLQLENIENIKSLIKTIFSI